MVAMLSVDNVLIHCSYWMTIHFPTLFSYHKQVVLLCVKLNNSSIFQAAIFDHGKQNLTRRVPRRMAKGTKRKCTSPHSLHGWDTSLLYPFEALA